MSFLRNKTKKKVIAFVDQIDLLSRLCTDNKQKQYLEDQVKEARHFIEYNEWYVGFEILTESLYEIGYKMEASLIDIAKDIFLKADPAQSEETFWWLDELRKE